MSTPPRLLVVQHEDQCPPAMVGSWLAAAGVGCDVRRAHHGDEVPTVLADRAGLLVLGGHMGANDDAAYPWVTPTKELIRATTAAGMPFLGICLGHQLAAAALGGTVTRNPRGPLHTVCGFAPTQAGRRDPLTSALAAGEEVLHWNGDVVARLPEGATALATAPDGTVQAARFGERSWGVQFHPEVVPDQVSSWTPGPDPRAEAAVIADLRARLAELHRPWARLTTRFAEIVRGSGG